MKAEHFFVGFMVLGALMVMAGISLILPTWAAWIICGAMTSLVGCVAVVVLS